jgi:chaperone modulatory protein CbpM
MEYNIIKVYHGHLVDDEKKLTLCQLCSICPASPDEIVEMINQGILDHEGRRRSEWRFSWEMVQRIRQVQRLQHDLELNMAGAALALHLLDKIERLEAMLKNPHNYTRPDN